MKKKNGTPSKELKELLRQFSKSEIEHEFRKLTAAPVGPAECTILINAGLHTFPDSLFRGQRYVFYEGSVDLSSEKALKKFVTSRLRNLSKFLRSRKWSAVHIVISGHAALCMQVKLAVYRMTHIETTDWVFDGKGKYFPLQIPLRPILVAAAKGKKS